MKLTDPICGRVNLNEETATCTESSQVKYDESQRIAGEPCESKRMLSTLMQGLPGMIYRCRDDECWTMECVRGGCLDLTGYETGWLLGNKRVSYAQLIHPDDRERVRVEVKKALAEHRPFRLRYRIVTAQGREKWVREEGRGIFSAEGNLLALEGFVMDITECKQAEIMLRESEQKYRELADLLPQPVFEMDTHGNITFVNRSMIKLTGYTEEDFGGRLNTTHLVVPEDRSRVVESMRKILEGKDLGPMRFMALRKDGRTFPVIAWASPIIRNLKAIGLRGAILDVGELHQVEQVLRQSEEKYRQLFDMESDAIFLIEKESGRILEANEAAATLYGYTREELLQMKNVDVSAEPEATREATLNPQPKIPVRLHRGKDGTVFPVEITARQFDWQGAEALVVAVRDITERKKYQEVLQESEARYRAIVEDQSELITRMLPGGTLTFANNAYQRYFGEPSEELLGQSFWHHVYEEDREKLSRHFASLGSQNPTATIEHRVVLPGGEVRWQQWNDRALFDESGGIKEIQCVGRDITGQKATEEALRKAERKYRDIFENAVEGIFQSTSAGRFISVNPALARICGYESPDEMIQEIDDIAAQLYVDPSRRQAFVQTLERDGVVSNFENRIYRKDRTVRWISLNARAVRDANGEILYHEGSAEDITERKNLEDQLVLAQKMEAIGTLAGGIAHDFNNILGAIRGYTEMALWDVPKDSKTRSDLEEVLQASNRARDLVAQILAFSRQNKQEHIPVKISVLVKETLKLLRASLPSTIDIQSKIDATSDVVLADPTQIHQIMMNLCTNASHAMRETGGVLEVSLAAAHCETAGVGVDLPLGLTGRRVRLTVRDTGHGMDRATLSRIFDPYFTTKGPGLGTGLGLYVVQGIVRKHDGHINVESIPGKGSAFHLFFPALEKPVQAIAETAITFRRGDERILFVDDEEPLARLGKKGLERLGYGVTARTSSIEALEAFRAQPHKFDLVITDQTMPAMTGMELAKEIIRIRPDIPVILCTGYSEMTTPEQVKVLGIRAFIMKPIIIHKMADTIRDVLESRTP